MRTTELMRQEMLAQSLNIEFERFNVQLKAWWGNQFKNADSKHWNKKPDLIITNGVEIKHPTTEGIIPPIGIEFKNAENFDAITTGVITQLKGSYLNETYCIEEKKFKLNTLAFATTSSCADGKIYKLNYPDAANFFIERFCWKCRVAVLLKQNGEFVWSYRNWLFGLNGKIKGRYSYGGELLCQ